MTSIATPTIANMRLTAALEYAAMGWRVIPLHWPRVSPQSVTCSCGNRDCEKSIGKHPMTEHGLKDASTDEAVIRAWWAKWPAANVGVVTGAESGIFVLDVDGEEGMRSLAALMEEFGEPAETLEAVTGGGGLHLIFKHPGGTIPNSAEKLGPGLDTRGDGGYIVAPPSLHKSRARYAWKALQGPGDLTPIAIPDWLLSKLRKPKTASPEPNSPRPIEDRARYWLGKALADVTIGTRNERATWLACQLRDNRAGSFDAEQIMRDFAARCPQGNEPFTEREALAVLRSIMASPPREPARSTRLPGPPAPPPPASRPKPSNPPVGSAAELRERLTGIVDGTIYNVPWPDWPSMTRLTQALLPGSVCMVVGEPGVGKTFLVLQCLQYWHAEGFEPAVYFVEKDRKFHTHRLLAQLEGNGNYCDFEWVKEHGAEVMAAMDRHSAYIDELGKCIESGSPDMITLDNMIAWVREQCASRKRVLLIDPITAIDTGTARWAEDQRFIKAAQQECGRNGASLILLNHPKGTWRPGKVHGHDQGGGAAYFRFSDTDIWIERPKQKPLVSVRRSASGVEGAYAAGTESVIEAKYIFHLQKTRDGRGAGCRIAFDFRDGLKFAEQGLVLGVAKKKKDEDEPE